MPAPGETHSILPKLELDNAACCNYLLCLNLRVMTFFRWRQHPCFKLYFDGCCVCSDLKFITSNCSTAKRCWPNNIFKQNCRSEYPTLHHNTSSPPNNSQQTYIFLSLIEKQFLLSFAPEGIPTNLFSCLPPALIVSPKGEGICWLLHSVHWLSLCVGLPHRLNMGPWPPTTFHLPLKPETTPVRN